MNTFTYDEISVGQEESFEFCISEDNMVEFRNITGDINPLHLDKDYAIKRGYKDRVCYGMLTASFLSTLAGVYLPGRASLIHSVQINMLQPVYINQPLICFGIVANKSETSKAIKLVFRIISKDSEENLVSGNMRILVADA